MKMTPLAVVTGSLLILAAIVFVVILLPYVHTSQTTPSEIFRQRSDAEAAGRELYIANGCVYCHSQSIRTIDWGLGAERIAQAGDYVSDHPSCWAPSAPDRICPRAAASTPTTGMWPILRTRGTRARCPSCRRLNSWAMKTWGTSSATSRDWA
jgi:hypothetical protein